VAFCVSVGDFVSICSFWRSGEIKTLNQYFR